MPRGIGYGYDDYMLVRPEIEVEADRGDDEDVDDALSYEYDDWWANFKAEVRDIFKADTISEWTAREAHLFAETDRMKIGIDSGGDCPCIFIQPKEFFPFGDENRDPEQYAVKKIVTRGFNRLLKSHAEGTFGVSLSWLHGKVITKYG